MKLTVYYTFPFFVKATKSETWVAQAKMGFYLHSKLNQ